MGFDIKSIIMIVTISLLIGFLVGWINPVEGPIDFIYDNYASQPAHRRPSVSAPLQPKQFIIDINDLSEEDFEALQEIFRNR